MEGVVVNKALYPHHKRYFVFPVATDAPNWAPLIYNPLPTSPDKK
jgi:hypothetical protein